MKKTLILAIKIGILIFSLFLINKTFEFILIDYSDDNFKSAMERFYSHDDIDTLFLGSSHLFCGVNPDILEEKCDGNIYLEGTPVQKPDTSYYLLKEACKKNDIKKVYLEMYYWVFREENINSRGDDYLPYAYAVSDYMKPSIDKYRFIFHSTPRERLITALLPATRYSDQLFNLEHIEKTLKSKDHSSHEDSKTPEPNENGFIGLEVTQAPEENTETLSCSKMENGKWIEEVTPSESVNVCHIGKYAQKYLQKIIDYCTSNDIELVLFCTPMTDYQLAILNDYDNYHQEIARIAEQNNIVFWDFNLLKPEYHPFFETRFGDIHHLSSEGADEFTSLLGEFINNDISSNDTRYFSQSLSEKWKQENSRLFGLQVSSSDGEYLITPFANFEIDADVYEVIGVALNEDGQPIEDNQTLLSFGGGHTFSLPTDVPYSIQIRTNVLGQIVQSDNIVINNTPDT